MSSCLGGSDLMLLDTNIVIHASQPGGGWLSPWTGPRDAAIASVSRVEALGFAGISRDEEAATPTLKIEPPRRQDAKGTRRVRLGVLAVFILRGERSS
jgi:hypothetical protein